MRRFFNFGKSIGRLSVRDLTISRSCAFLCSLEHCPERPLLVSIGLPALRYFESVFWSGESFCVAAAGAAGAAGGSS